MRLRCPACGSSWSLDAVIAHDGAREAVLAALQLPAPIGRWLIPYVALFRPPKRDLSLDRLADLLGELLAMVQEGRVERGGKSHPVPAEVWPEALRDMLDCRDKLRLPLKSHGYLVEILLSHAARADLQSAAASAEACLPEPARVPSRSKTAQGLLALERMKHG